MISRSSLSSKLTSGNILKVVLIVLAILIVLLFARWAANKYHSLTSAEAQAAKDRQAAVAAQAEAQQAKGEAEQLRQQVVEKDRELVEANQRAALANARYQEAKAAREVLQRAYQDTRTKQVDFSAPAPDNRAVCERMKSLGILPETFQCNTKP